MSEQQTTENPFVLTPVRIAKRGKGAKGTQEVNLLGKPIYNADGSLKELVISHLVEGRTLTQVITGLESIQSVNARMLCYSAIEGLNEILSSTAKQQEIERTAMVRYILEQGLAMDYADAKEYVMNCQKVMEYSKKAGELVKSIEDYAVRRRVFVQEQKDKNLWIINTKSVDEIISEGLAAEAIAEAKAEAKRLEAEAKKAAK